MGRFYPVASGVVDLDVVARGGAAIALVGRGHIDELVVGIVYLDGDLVFAAEPLVGRVAGDAARDVTLNPPPFGYGRNTLQDDVCDVAAVVARGPLLVVLPLELVVEPGAGCLDAEVAGLVAGDLVAAALAVRAVVGGDSADLGTVLVEDVKDDVLGGSEDVTDGLAGDAAGNLPGHLAARQTRNLARLGYDRW